MAWKIDRTTGTGLRAADVALAPRQILEGMVAALPDPVLLCDGQGLVLCANEGARLALPNLRLDQHVAQAIRAPAVLEAVEKTLRNGGSRKVEYQMRLPALRHFEITIAAMPARAITDASVVVVLKDLTREHLVEQTRSDFVANASHELRTPLASLLGFIETLQGSAKEDAKARSSFLALMLTQANRMKRLIDDLLSLSRIEMDEHLKPVEKIDLVLVICHVKDLLGMMAEKEGVALEITLPPQLKVRGSWDELVQVHLNLIENAIKYGAIGKRVVISGQKIGDEVEIIVQDFGPGISPEHIPRLTERFYRVDVQQSRSRGGTGLGLAIVKHILNRHDGRLTIQSNLGQGSLFTIRLPI